MRKEQITFSFMYNVFLIFTLIFPLWVNSYSVLGIRYKFITINFPLLLFLIGISGIILNALNKLHTLHFRIKNINLIDLLIVINILWNIIALILANDFQSYRNYYLYSFPFYYYLIVRLLNTKCYYSNVLIYWGILVAILGIVEYITRFNPFLPPKVIYKGFYYMYNRVQGYQPSVVFDGPNTLGLFLNSVSLLLLYRRKRFFEFSYVSKFFILIIGSIISLSRVNLIGVSIILILFIKNFNIKYKKVFIIIIVLLLIMLVIVFIYPHFKSRLLDIKTALDRPQLWKKCLRILYANNILLGIGYDKLRDTKYLGSPAHNSFLNILVEQGFVGVIIWFLMWYFIFYRLKKDYTYSQTAKFLIWFGVLYHIVGLFHSAIFMYKVRMLYFIILGNFINRKKPIIIYHHHEIYSINK